MRNLDSQIAWYRRLQLVAGGLLVAGLAVFYLASYRPFARQLYDLHLQIHSKERDLALHQERASTLPMVLREVERLRERLARFDKKLPRDRDLPKFLHEIEELRQRSGLTKWHMRPEAARRKGLVTEQPLTVSFEGDFTQVASFLTAAESMERQTRVRQVVIRSTDAKAGLVAVQLGMSIYFSEG